MINAIDLTKLRNGEYTQFLKDVRDIVGRKGPSALNIQPQYDKLAIVITDLERLFKTPQGNIISEELEALDLRRDNAIIAINSIATGYTYATDPATSSAAKLLLNHLAVFGGSNVARDSYQSETMSLDNILKDWNNKPELSAAIVSLHLQALKAELADANSQFSIRYLDRASELGIATPESIRAKRGEANAAYYTLRDFINSYFTINSGAEPFSSTVGFINGLVANYNDLIARRGPNEINGTENTAPSATPAV